MDNFTARKLGEVLAFAQVGLETYEKGKVALVAATDADTVARSMDGAANIADRIAEFAAMHGLTEAVFAKADATTQKLRTMREVYLKEEGWQDPAEMCEWLGFFEGAGTVHWAVIAGAGDAMGSADLQAMSKDGAKLHHDLLHDIIEGITRIAKTKADPEHK
jgi:hypothetical protein